MFGSVVRADYSRLHKRPVELVAFVTDRQMRLLAVRTGEQHIRENKLVALEAARATGKPGAAAAQGDHAVGHGEVAGLILEAGDGAERIAAVHGVDALP